MVENARVVRNVGNPSLPVAGREIVGFPRKHGLARNRGSAIGVFEIHCQAGSGLIAAIQLEACSGRLELQGVAGTLRDEACTGIALTQIWLKA